MLQHIRTKKTSDKNYKSPPPPQIQFSDGLRRPCEMVIWRPKGSRPQVKNPCSRSRFIVVQHSQHFSGDFLLIHRNIIVDNGKSISMDYGGSHCYDCIFFPFLDRIYVERRTRLNDVLLFNKWKVPVLNITWLLYFLCVDSLWFYIIALISLK